MIRALLHYQGDSIELPTGETVVGRGVGCRIRFNDPSVSREHLRFRLQDGKLTIEDLGSSNGTLLNGKKISGTQAVKTGDVIRLGRRLVEVGLERGAGGDEAGDTTRHDVVPAPVGMQVPEINCPSCRAWIPADLSQCSSCGKELARDRPHSPTRMIDIKEIEKERRLGQRYATKTPIFYSSDNLAIDAQAHDLSLSGVFVATDLLDDIGSDCNITLLPDGGAPVLVAGVVRRVVTGEPGQPSGMGVEFKVLTASAEKWLITHLQRVASQTN
jgi:pSer/pThr/pTyr-binding forkhead associated (FHA) protein